MKREFDPAEIDWYCDNCDESLNFQDGFDPYGGSWECTNCGCLNFLTESDVLWDDDDDDPDSNGGLSVYDAACIWMSNGKDEDYTFGYSEEELEEALE